MTPAGAPRLSAREVAALTGGRLLGPGEVTVGAVAPLDRAGPGDLSFLAAIRYLPYFQRSRASIVLVAPPHEDATTDVAVRIVVPDPHAALLEVLPVLYPEPVWTPGVHPTASIGHGVQWETPVAVGPHVVLGDGVRLGRNVRIGPGCILGQGVEVGDESVLFPRVVCYPRSVIGRRVSLHAGVVIGSDGFGYVAERKGGGGGEHRKIPQVGRAVIGDDVEIGANTTIDRGSVDDTVIGPGTKIDNLVVVAHNARIGARCLVMAQAAIAGSTRLGDDVIVAGQVGIAGHLSVGAGARIGGGSGVARDIPAGETVFGYPARERMESLRAQAALFRLARIVDELEALVGGRP